MFNTTAWNRLRYTAYAPIYDAVAARVLHKPREAALAQVAWAPGMRVLLVGAGTGLDLPLLPPDTRVHATDLSAAMVKRTADRAARLNRDVDCRVMDAEALTYPDAHFDVVVMHFILAVMPDPARGLAETYRVLKPGGQLCLLDKFQPDHRPAGAGRRLLNAATSAIATDITRRATPLLEDAGFIVKRDTPVLMGSVVRALIATQASPTAR
ncbi:class I SAM-dependent methyltransferase [Halomonas piscis]|uniref:Class I SAM-dependent methyltransferase n=1 Tax=Halomonas piscis TaxID=3031727 RepID=A0ABY9Z195_9GAMM|nr:class I SAM-dependent methyltransferase [Halomonas piscis]WNK20812.1 class I SAM-dependent methyltransferase [Halomonas piscis]